MYRHSNELFVVKIVIENDDKYDTNITVVVRDSMNDNRVSYVAQNNTNS